MVIILFLIANRGKIIRNPFCNNCDRAPVPMVDRGTNRLYASQVMMNYKIDDNCNFQTLFFDPYGASPQISKPFAILARFNGQHLPYNKYKINKLELKAYEFRLRATGDDKKYRVEYMNLSQKSNHGNIFLEIRIIEDNKHTDIDKVDYIYGDKGHPVEDPIILNTDAEIEIEVTIVDMDGVKPVLGGYECNGKATVGGG